MERILPVFIFAFVLTVFIYFYLLYESRQKKIWIKKRFFSSGEKGEFGILPFLREIFLAAAARCIPKKGKEFLETKKKLVYAGYRSETAIAVYYGIRAMLPLVFAFLFLIYLMITGKNDLNHFIRLIFPVAAGYYLPVYILNNRVKTRNKLIFRELPDSLDLLVICIEAGLGFEAALFRISRELEDVAPVLSKEFARYFFETQSGVPRNDALTAIKKRNDEEGLKSVIDVLYQSVRFGTDIASALRVYSDDMRTKRRQIAEEKGAKVATKLTLPLIVLILPVLLIIILGPAVIRLLDRVGTGFF